MEILAELMRYLMKEATPLAVVLMVFVAALLAIIWLGYKLLLRKEQNIEDMGEILISHTNQIATNNNTQVKIATLLEQLIYGKIRSL